MRQQLPHQFWIVVAGAVIFFTTLGATGLWDEDEPLYASCAREMLERGDWVVPWFNGQMFPDKPPLMFWTMMSGFGLFGVNELGARFWSAVFGVATALATYHLGRRLFRAEVGLWGGLIVSSSIIFTVSARAATVDSALTLATTMAILFFVLGRTWIAFALMYASMGVAVLAKGPVGLLLPAATIGLFLLIINDPRNFFRSAWQMRPLTGIAVVAAVALPWYVLVGLRTDGVWLEQFFAKYNLRPFMQPILGHHGPVWYYVPAILIGFFPWSVFAVPTLIDLVRRLRGRDAWRTGTILLLCWLGVFFVFWSICSTKLPHYVLPAYPALALLTACFVDGWITGQTPVSRAWLRAALGITILVGIGFISVFPVVASVFAPGEGWLGLVGLILVVGGGLSLYCSECSRPRHAAAVFAVTSVVFLTAIFGLAALRVDRHQYAKALVAQIRRAGPEQPELASYRFTRESVIFYARQPVPCLDDVEELRRYLDGSKAPCILTTDEHQGEIERCFPDEFYVLDRRPRFLRSGEMVVLVRRTATNLRSVPDGPRTAGRAPGGNRQ